MAQRWVDFMLSKRFQEDMPLQMYVFPVNSSAKLDPTFEKFLAVPEKPAAVAPDLIRANRDRWIEEWRNVVLR
jgi:thiamine transport system substrate-binding protein